MYDIRSGDVLNVIDSRNVNEKCIELGTCVGVEAETIEPCTCLVDHRLPLYHYHICEQPTLMWPIAMEHIPT